MDKTPSPPDKQGYTSNEKLSRQLGTIYDIAVSCTFLRSVNSIAHILSVLGPGGFFLDEVWGAKMTKK